MGVPGLYGWVKKRFKPSVTILPKGFNAENVYIDVNGIIHPCCHNDGALELEDSENISDRLKRQEESSRDKQRFYQVAKKLTELVELTRPQKVLYLAIDGPAPNAKAGQQRSRRYMDVLDKNLKGELDAKMRKEYDELGFATPPNFRDPQWDKNAISVGTKFMQGLKEYLVMHVKQKQRLSPLWKNLNVVLSDSTVPGEGEHKILSYIRENHAENERELWRLEADQQKGHYSVNGVCKHLIVSDDGDLFLLGLALKQSNVMVMRDEQRRMSNIVSNTSNTNFRYHQEKLRINRLKYQKRRRMPATDAQRVQYELLNLDSVKAQLSFYFRQTALLNVDVDRVIADLILMSCFFGNDFIPPLPNLSIGRSGLDDFLLCYTSYLKSTDSWERTGTAKLYFSTLGKQINDGKIPLNYVLHDAVSEPPAEAEEKEPLPYLVDESSKIIFSNLQRFMSIVADKRDELLHHEAKGHKLAKSSCESYQAGEVCDKGELCMKQHGSVVPFQTYERNLKSIITNYALGKYQEKEQSETLQTIDTSNLVFSKDIAVGVKNGCLEISDVPIASPINSTIRLCALHNRLYLKEQLYTDDEGLSLVSHVIGSYNPIWSGHYQKVFVSEYIGELNRRKDTFFREPKEGLEFEQKKFEAFDTMKKGYYEDKFGWAPDDPSSDAKIRNLSIDYLQTVQFVVSYYLKGLPSWDHYYPAHYSPFTADICSLLKSMDEEAEKKISFENSSKTRPMSTFAQLLCLCPPKSYPLLPSVLQKYLLGTESSDESLLQKVEEFKQRQPDLSEQLIDRNGREFRWLSILNIPINGPENYNLASAIVEECKKKDYFTSREMDRLNQTFPKHLLPHYPTTFDAHKLRPFSTPVVLEQPRRFRPNNAQEPPRLRQSKLMVQARKSSSLAFSCLRKLL